jgi:threonyl-tRNA synthetase
MQLSDDPLFRNELSGVASGLFRVKVLTQDDAHVIATEDQAEEELAGMLEMMERVYGVFNLEYKAKISTRPDGKRSGSRAWAATSLAAGRIARRILAFWSRRPARSTSTTTTIAHTSATRVRASFASACTVLWT